MTTFDIECDYAEALDRAPTREQYLYIAGGSRDGPLKIGIASDPYRRRAGLQTGYPHLLKVFWVYPCPYGILEKHRMQGEWFDVPVEVAIGALWLVATSAEPDDTPSSLTDDVIKQCCRHIGMPW